ncbi:site-specific integrase [Tetragenococcus koreensis]|uniref:site-specific integrase n=1 Tax=Tetragenococcus koreensis TaxID=290335 RepID=UPI001F30683D|nr:site-specific integrase [Tetragenococcus koreensis]MDN6281169.1 site-specific integrase [Psychroflexus sp.]MDN6641417.1 site-specific integrase [Tetragenococcus sp.]MDN6731622.1 site-specific integrase [Atopostipes suicloacalis]MDN6836786.1 site-specific integrase [Lactococcus lactis]MCF1586368.1 site-specific integrase [Tetragenococcus koreensis]
MANFKQYTKKDGTKLWQFQAYLGTDPITGKSVKTTRRNFKTKEEAQLALSRLQVDFENNGLNKSNKMTFKELYKLWFEQHSKDVKPTTNQRIRIYFDNHILKDLGRLKLDKITPLYCQKKLNRWAETLVTYKQMERTVIPKSKNNDDKKESYYTKNELRQFFDCLKLLDDQRAFTFFRVLAFCGLRKGEAMALLWSDIDFNENTISIDKTLAELQSGKSIIQSTKTETSRRTIKVDHQTIMILKKWKNHILQERLRLGLRNEKFQESVVFCNSILDRDNAYLYKAYPNNVLKKVQKYFPDMKMIKVHDFRKTNASLLFESGASIKDVSQRLGHKSTKTTTDIYIKVTETKQSKTADEFEKYMAF